jgi:lipoate-protein ligase B
MDLTPFSWIAPCGMTGLTLTDLRRASGRSVTVIEAAAAAVAAWRAHFGDIAEEDSDGLCGG